MLRLLPSKVIPPDRLETLLAIAAASPEADRSLDYPAWYLHRWHFLRDGYLSRSSVRHYDRFIRPMYHAIVEPRSLATARALLARIRPASVLEIGCGPGRALESVRRELPAAALAGVDLSPYMLELARARLGPGADLHHANATALPFAAGRFDAALSLHVAGHMPADDAAHTLAEIVRVLRPGGWLVTVEHRWHRLPWPASLRLVAERPAGLRFAILRLHRHHATAGEALAAMRQSGPTPEPGRAT